MKKSTDFANREFHAAIAASVWLLSMLILKLAVNRLLPPPDHEDYPEALPDER